METLISDYLAMPILRNQKSRQEMMCLYTNTHITRKFNLLLVSVVKASVR